MKETLTEILARWYEALIRRRVKQYGKKIDQIQADRFLSKTP